MELNISSGHNQIHSREIENQLGSQFETANYKKVIRSYNMVPPHKNKIYPAKTYNNNLQYWKDIRDRSSFEGDKITLKSFHILEWLPQYPGQIHTEDSQSLIDFVKRHGDTNENEDGSIEYLPGGKNEFINAGFGSMRFGVKIIEDKQYFLLSASSSGISHEGIPLVLNKDLYGKTIKEIKKSFGVLANITGEIRLIPHSQNPILNWRFPSYYFFVSDLSIIRESNEGETAISVAIMYSLNREKTKNFNWTFKQFYPDPNDENLFSSVSWMKNYAKRYVDSGTPFLIGEFDELIPHFNNLDFELIKTTNNIIPRKNIKQITDKYDINLQGPNHDNEYFRVDSDRFHQQENDSGTYRVGDHVHSKLSDLLTTNRIEECIDYLSLEIDDYEINNYLILTKSRHDRINKSIESGLISFEESNIYRNRIINSILNTIQKYQ